MDSKQNSHYLMFQSTYGTMNSNSGIWSGNSTISALVATLLANIGTIGTTDAQQTADTTGPTTTKNGVKNLLISTMLANAAAGYGYAASLGNDNLKAICHITLKDLSDMSEGDLVGASINLYNALNPVAASLGTWGASAATLSSQQSTQGSFSGNIGLPATARALTKAASQTLPTLITSTTDLLDEQLDRAMLQYKTTKPIFYKQYKNSRKLPKVGTHTSGFIRCVVTDGTGNPIADTVLEIVGITRAKKKVNAKGKGGYARIKTPVTVTITASAPGHLPQSHTLNLNTNGIFKLNFVLALNTSTGGTPTTGGTTAGS